MNLTAEMAHTILGAILVSYEYEESYYDDYEVKVEEDLIDQIAFEYPKILQYYVKHPYVSKVLSIHKNKKINEAKRRVNEVVKDLDKPTKPVFTKLNPVEKRRTYYYTSDDKDETYGLDFYNVCSIAVSSSGTHRLETTNGNKFIVSPGWKYIALDVEEWTF